jgi:hypothetical protein
LSRARELRAQASRRASRSMMRRVQGICCIARSLTSAPKPLAVPQGARFGWMANVVIAAVWSRGCSVGQGRLSAGMARNNGETRGPAAFKWDPMGTLHSGAAMAPPVAPAKAATAGDALFLTQSHRVARLQSGGSWIRAPSQG